jgi:hypothetical protein
MTEKQASKAIKRIGYMPNGVFITATIHCGFECKVYEDTPNPCFNVSEASVKALEKELVL